MVLSREGAFRVHSNTHRLRSRSATNFRAKQLRRRSVNDLVELLEMNRKSPNHFQQLYNKGLKEQNDSLEIETIPSTETILEGRRNQKHKPSAEKHSSTTVERPASPQSPSTNSQRKRKTGFSLFKSSSRKRVFEPNDPRQLIFAIRQRDLNRLRFILDNCPEEILNGTDSMGVTGIHEAALTGQMDMLSLLLKHGADVKLSDKDGFTCLDYAVYAGHFECAEYLIDNGAIVNNIQDGVLMFKGNDWL